MYGNAFTPNPSPKKHVSCRSPVVPVLRKGRNVTYLTGVDSESEYTRVDKNVS